MVQIAQLAMSRLATNRIPRLLVEWTAAAAVSIAALRIFLTEDFLRRPPVSDRGGYVLISKLIVGGAVLYRDIWDNKPPMIHLLGALAWSLSPDVRAVWEMERIAILLMAAVMFAMLRYGFGVRFLPALAGLLIGLVTFRNPDVFCGGHLTEEYGIVFEMATIACLAIALRGWGAAWATVAGGCAALTLLTRQTFFASLVAIWLAGHALPLLRQTRRVVRLIVWELVGFAFPVVAWTAYLWCTGSVRLFLQLAPETLAFGAAPIWRYAGQDTLSGRVALGLHWMVVDVFHDKFAVAVGTAIVGVAATAAALRRDCRGRSLTNLTPLVLPLWFAAELVAASTPGNYYGAYYMPFVPIWACLFALVAELLLPTGRRRGSLVRLVSCVAVLVTALVTFDASYRIDPKKDWWDFVADTGLPPAIVERLRADAEHYGRHSYVPLIVNSPDVLFDMPLRLGSRFLGVNPYQFGGPDSPRGRELLADIERADVIIEDRKRLRLDRMLELRIQTILQQSFAPTLYYKTFRFHVRRTPVDPGGVQPG